MLLHNKPIRLALCILVFAAIFRIVLFSGFVLGDDPAYADYVHRIINGTYPRIGSHEVFACRPLLLYAIALPIFLFGWHEWAFVLPILLCSLTNCALVFIGGYWIAGWRAASLAALAYATFPLDVVHATTLSNDIVLTTIIWGGAFLFFASHNYSGRNRRILALSGGIITGTGVAVKFNALVAPLVLIPAFFFYLVSIKKSLQELLTICWWTLGWGCAQVLLMLFLYANSGNPLAHYHAEINFNRDFNPSGFVFSDGALIRFLLYYPKLIIGILQEGHAGWQFMPYGYFFLYFFLCLPLAGFKSFRALRLPAACGLAFLLIMEFAPLKWSPVYIPIHRLPRFLHIASIPAAITIGVAAHRLFSARSRLVIGATAGAFFFLLLSSCYWSYKKAHFYHDCVQDQRWAWTIASSISTQRIITDIEIKNYFMFRSGFHFAVPIEAPNKIPVYIPHGSLIITGGARRPDMDPYFTVTWRGYQPLDTLRLIAEGRFPLRPWRASQIQIFMKD